MSYSIPLRAAILAICVHMLWGGNTVGAKFGLEMLGPMWSAFVRFVLGIVCIAIFAHFTRERLWPSTSEWRPIAYVGALFTLQIATMNIGIDLSTGSMSSVLIATNPLFAAMFAHWLLAGSRLTPTKVAGLTLAFAGAVTVLLLGTGKIEASLTGFGNLVCVISAAILGGRLVMSANALSSITPMKLAVWQMVVSLPVFAALGFAFETVNVDQIGWKPIAGLVYQGVVVAGIGFTASFWLMKRYQPTVMMSFNFVSPIAGVMLSWWLLGDDITVWLLAGMALVAAGLVLIARS